MRRLALFLFIAALALPAFGAADGAVTVGEQGLNWADPFGSGVKRMSQQTIPAHADSEFENVAAGAAEAITFSVVAPGTLAEGQPVILERVIVWSADCADCDVAITEEGNATEVIYSNDALVATTIPDPTSNAVDVPVTYTQYTNAVINSAGGTTGVTLLTNSTVIVSITNHDGVVRDVGVKLFWRTR